MKIVNAKCGHIQMKIEYNCPKCSEYIWETVDGYKGTTDCKCVYCKEKFKVAYDVEWEGNNDEVYTT